MLTPAHCRAARAWLNWRQEKLAQMAGVGTSTIADFERGARRPMRNNIRAIRAAFETAGIVIRSAGISGPL